MSYREKENGRRRRRSPSPPPSKRQKTAESVSKKNQEEEDDEEYQRKVAQQLQMMEGEDEELRAKRREERRRRLAEIAAAAAANPQVQSNTASSSTSDAVESANPPSSAAENGEKDTNAQDKGQADDSKIIDLTAPDSTALPTNESIEDHKKNNTKKQESPVIDLFDPNLNFDDDAREGKRKAELKLIVRNADPSDDKEGYYSFQIGEVLNKRYQVLGFHGQGVFSNVLKAMDLEEKKEVAIKLLRSHDLMKRAGRKEMKILRTLSDADPESKCNVIQLLSSFEDRDHLCLVLEPMDLNLRQILKKYGHNVGLSIKAVRFYAFKLIKALTLLRKCGIVHADIKPDNILVNNDRTIVKLGDLGSAFEINEAETTEYLVSRFYRAPEIILGYDLGYPLDMFSLGACLYELATGAYMLPSRNNNHHLKLIMEIKGMVPKKMLAKCKFKDRHFDNDGNFLEYVDVVGGRDIVKRVYISKPTRSIQQEILKSYGDAIKTPEEKKHVEQLADLIDKCLVIDPKKRITPDQALKHPLFD